MNHDSWILNHPTSNPAEDAHTIALVNPWKFHSDWSSHVGAYRVHRPGFRPSPHTPLYIPTPAGSQVFCPSSIGISTIHNVPCRLEVLVSVFLGPMYRSLLNVVKYQFVHEIMYHSSTLWWRSTVWYETVLFHLFLFLLRLIFLQFDGGKLCHSTMKASNCLQALLIVFLLWRYEELRRWSFG